MCSLGINLFVAGFFACSPYEQFALFGVRQLCSDRKIRCPRRNFNPKFDFVGVDFRYVKLFHFFTFCLASGFKFCLSYSI